MGESAISIATSASAPATERYDAQAELTKSTLASELIPATEIQPVIDYIRDSWVEHDLAKAQGRGQLIQFPGSGRSAQRGPSSVLLDEYQVQMQGDYWDRPGILGFDSMRAMVEQTPILNGIVLTRIRQVQRFCRPQVRKTDPGFVVQHVDPNVELNDDQQRSCQLLQSFLLNGGWETNPRRRKRMGRDSFSTFMAKSLRDSLSMDAAPIETEFKRDRSLGLDGFYALDGSTIRLCTEKGYQGDDQIFALQVIQGQVRTAYTYDSLVYEVRNPRTDVTACGYGYSETEMLIRVVTYLINTMTYNGSFFDSNAIPRGILNLYGNYDAGDIQAFKRYWNSMVRGITNAHSLPVMVSKDNESKADFVEIGGQLNEMSFGKWLSWLTSIACAIYQIAPEEISMESYSAGKSSLSGEDTEERLTSSTDKGLRPLMGHYENILSDFVIQEFDPQYCFRFVGLDGEDADKRHELTKLTATWNEVRTQLGSDPIDGPMGDAPLNPSFLPIWQQVAGVGLPEPEEQEQGDFGDPDAAPEGDGADAAQGRDATQDAAGPAQDDASQEASPFGQPAEEDAPMAKGLTAADFGLPAIYVVED